MTEPVTAADVMRNARLQRWNGVRPFGTTLDDDMIAALREACGGGDIVIRVDGTLATLKTSFAVDEPIEAAWLLACVVPVERGA